MILITNYELHNVLPQCLMTLTMPNESDNSRKPLVGKTKLFTHNITLTDLYQKVEFMKSPITILAH